MKKSNLRIGDMIEIKYGDRYIMTSNETLSSINSGFVDLECYNENLLFNDSVLGKSGNDIYDIIKVYRPDEYGSYECIWERQKNEMLTKEYLIEQIDTSEDCKGEHWDIKIKPNNFKGYGKADGNMQIVLSNVDNYYDDNLFLSVQGAKEMIKALNEIIDYLKK